MSANRKRTLAVIAGDIHRVEQANIFEVGDYLIEAKDICEHGEWLDWIAEEFQWSNTTADRYMSASRLAIKFPKLKNLRLGRTTLYELAEYEDDELLPAIIAELAGHAKKERLKPAEATRFIKIAKARMDYGDRPDATLWALSRGYDDDIVEALKAANPETDEAVEKIINDVMEARGIAREAERAKREAEQDEVEPVEDELDEDELEPEPKAVKATARPEPKPVKPEPMPGQIGPMWSSPPEMIKDAVVVVKEGIAVIDPELVDSQVDAARKAYVAAMGTFTELEKRKEIVKLVKAALGLELRDLIPAMEKLNVH